MPLPLRCIAPLLFAGGLLLALSAQAQEDIRQVVRPAAAFLSEGNIDLAGVAYGLPFGATEDEIIQKFGKPTGYLRADAHRTAFIYGKSHLLLCYDGKFDAIRINPGVIDWDLASYIQEAPPFNSDRWELSNGAHSEMNLKGLRAITKGELLDDRYQFVFATDQCRVQINLSRTTNQGDSDEVYHAYGLLVASKRDGKDRWSDPPPGFVSSTESLKGKKLLGLLLADSSKGVRIISVYKDSPGDNAGIKPGDLITALDGASAVGMSASDFRGRVSADPKPTLEIVGADGNKRTVSLEPADGATFSNQMVEGAPSFMEVKEGDDAPDFEARANDGRTFKLSELRGSPVLVNFTGSWCGPCKLEAPHLVAAYAKYRDRGLKMVSVYLDTDDKDVVAYAKTLGADWPISTDGKVFDNAVARAYGVHAVPTNVLIGPNGKIASGNLRGARLDPALEKAVSEP